MSDQVIISINFSNLSAIDHEYHKISSHIIIQDIIIALESIKLKNQNHEARVVWRYWRLAK